MDVIVKRLPHGQGLPLPDYQSAHAAGIDLPLAVETSFTLNPGQIALLPTGFAFAIPHGYEGQVRPRSGLAVKHGITLINSPGTIDSDYRGEVKVALINLGSQPFALERGQRIAQMVIAPVMRAGFSENRILSETARGDGGFGHTGE